MYTWEAHDQNNRPIIGSRKVLFDQGRTSLEVMCDQQLIRRTYYDEKKMILEERFLADNIYPIENEDKYYRSEAFQERECARSLATQTYYTEYGLVHAIKWFTIEDIDPDVEVPPPPEPDGVFEVCVEK